MNYKKVGLKLGATRLSQHEIIQCLERKIDIPENGRVLIMTDDTFRPNTQLHKEVVEYVMERTHAGNTVIVVASGMHRQSTQEELESKLGSIIRQVRLYRHSPFVRFPFEKFKDYTKISIGTILPHIFVKRGGGGKIVVPGLASIHGATHFHNQSRAEAMNYIGRLEREIDYVVSGVINSLGEVVNVVINDMPMIHSPLRMSKYNFGVRLEEPADAVILEPLFKNGDFMQSMNVLRLCKYDIVKRGGTICIACNPRDGMGVHYLFQQPNGTKPVEFDVAFSRLINGRRLEIICPNISPYQIQEYFGNPVLQSFSLESFLKFGNYENVVHYVGADVMLPEGV